jgi:hypothetical protein
VHYSILIGQFIADACAQRSFDEVSELLQSHFDQLDSAAVTLCDAQEAAA